MNNVEDIDSPCVGFCSTTYGDDFCKGCYRHFEQVINWEKSSMSEKKNFYHTIAKKVKSRLDGQVTVECMSSFLEGCRVYSISIQQDICIEYHIYQLLQKASLKLGENSYGLKNHTQLTWSELYVNLDKQLYKDVSIAS